MTRRHEPVNCDVAHRREDPAQKRWVTCSPVRPFGPSH
jgi:hypothetical protein